MTLAYKLVLMQIETFVYVTNSEGIRSLEHWTKIKQETADDDFILSPSYVWILIRLFST